MLAKALPPPDRDGCFGGAKYQHQHGNALWASPVFVFIQLCCGRSRALTTNAECFSVPLLLPVQPEQVLCTACAEGWDSTVLFHALGHCHNLSLCFCLTCHLLSLFHSLIQRAKLAVSKFCHVSSLIWLSMGLMDTCATTGSR